MVNQQEKNGATIISSRKSPKCFLFLMCFLQTLNYTSVIMQRAVKLEKQAGKSTLCRHMHSSLFPHTWLGCCAFSYCSAILSELRRRKHRQNEAFGFAAAHRAAAELEPDGCSEQIIMDCNCIDILS